MGTTARSALARAAALAAGLTWLALAAGCGCTDGRPHAALLCAPTPSGMTRLTDPRTGRAYGSPVLRDVCERLIDSSRGDLVCAPVPSGMVQLTNVATGAELGSPLLVEECEHTVAESR